MTTLIGLTRSQLMRKIDDRNMHEAKMYAGFSKCNTYVHCYSFVRLQELMLMTIRASLFF